MGKASRARKDKHYLRMVDSVKADMLRYDMRNPCSDCPFSTNAPWHQGIMEELARKTALMDAGHLAHTCHQTDARADCAATKRAPNGAPMQHCAGMLIMAEKTGLQQRHMFAAQIRGAYNPAKLNLNGPVFDSMGHMFSHYLSLSLKNVNMAAAQRAEISSLIDQLNAASSPAPVDDRPTTS